MIINVTEEQKKLIESQGYMVVEFKLWHKKIIELIIEYASRVIDTWKQIILFLQDKILKAFDRIKELSFTIAEDFKSFNDNLESVYDTCKKYAFVRELGNKNYRCFFHKKKIRRARSCC